MINMTASINQLYSSGVHKSKACGGIPVITPEIKQKVLMMIEQGYSVKFISDALGVCKTTVHDLKVIKSVTSES